MFPGQTTQELARKADSQAPPQTRGSSISILMTRDCGKPSPSQSQTQAPSVCGVSIQPVNGGNAYVATPVSSQSCAVEVALLPAFYCPESHPHIQMPGSLGPNALIWKTAHHGGEYAWWGRRCHISDERCSCVPLPPSALAYPSLPPSFSVTSRQRALEGPRLG